MAHELCSKCKKLRYRTEVCLGSAPCPLKLRVTEVAATKSTVAPSAPAGGPNDPDKAPRLPARAVDTKSHAKATKAKPKKARPESGGVASRTSRGVGSPASDPTTLPNNPHGLVDQAPEFKRGRGRPPSPNPKSPRAAYQRELMRKRREEAKGK